MSTNTPYHNILIPDLNGSAGQWGTIVNEALRTLEAMYGWNPFDTVVIGSGADGSANIELQISGGGGGAHYWSLKHKTDDTFSLTYDGTDKITVAGSLTTLPGSVEFSVSGSANIGSDSFPALRTYTKIVQGPDGADLYMWGAPDKSVRITDGSDTTRAIFREGYANRFYDTTGALCLDVDANLGVYGDITPALASTSDVGTAAAPFASGFFDSLVVDEITLNGTNIVDGLTPTTSGASNLGSAALPYGEIISDQFRLNKDAGKIIFNDDNYLSYDDSTGELRLNGSTTNYIDIDNGFMRANTVYANTSFSAPNGSDVVIQAPASQATLINDSAGSGAISVNTSQITIVKNVIPNITSSLSVGTPIYYLLNTYCDNIHSENYGTKGTSLNITDANDYTRFYSSGNNATKIYGPLGSGGLDIYTTYMEHNVGSIPYMSGGLDFGGSAYPWNVMYAKAYYGAANENLYFGPTAGNGKAFFRDGYAYTAMSYAANEGLKVFYPSGTDVAIQVESDSISINNNIKTVNSGVNYFGSQSIPFGSVYSDVVYADSIIPKPGKSGILRLFDGDSRYRIYCQPGNPSYIYDEADNIGFGVYSSAISVFNKVIPNTDATYDLGGASNQFKDLYLTGDVIVNGVTLSPSGSTPTSSGVGDFASAAVPWGNIYSDVIRAKRINGLAGIERPDFPEGLTLGTGLGAIYMDTASRIYMQQANIYQLTSSYIYNAPWAVSGIRSDAFKGVSAGDPAGFPQGLTVSSGYHIKPIVSGASDIGSSALPWASIYTNNISINSSLTGRLVSSGSTLATEVNWKEANYQEFELTADWTPTFHNFAASGTAHVVTFFTKQDTTGGWTITWPAEVIWPGGSAPVATAGASTKDKWELVTLDSGATIYGERVGANYS